MSAANPSFSGRKKALGFATLISMDMRSLETYTRMHRLYADSFTASFTRLWNRELTEDEVNAIQSLPLCISGMMLEAIEREIALCPDSKAADSVYSQISNMVSQRRDELLQHIQKIYSEVGLSLNGPRQNFLALEENLLEHVRKTEPR